MVYRIRDRVEFDSATSETTLYVDLVAGNDGYDGTIDSPLATIQEAVYRFIPPYAPAPYWSKEEPRTIVVKYTPGMPSITEGPIEVPYHKGEGALVVKGEEETLYTVSEVGAPVEKDGYKSLYSIELSGTPLTPGEFDRDAFLTPSGAGVESFPGSNDTVVFSNTDGYVDIITQSIYFGFANYRMELYADGASFDIVRPQINWFVGTGGSTTSNGNYTDAVFNVAGGPIHIQGFQFDGYLGNPDRLRNRPIVINRETSNVRGNSFFFEPGASALIRRCIFNNYSAAPVGGSNIDVVACCYTLGEDWNHDLALRGSKSIGYYSFSYLGTVGYPRLGFNNCSDCKITGMYYDVPNSLTFGGSIAALTNSNISVHNADLIKAYASSQNNSYTFLQDVKIHSDTASNESFWVTRNSYMGMFRCENAGCDGYGLKIEKSSTALVDQVTIVGTQGEVLVGGQATTTVGRPFVNSTTDLCSYI